MPFWKSIGHFFSKVADDTVIAAKAVGTAAEDAGKAVATAAEDVGKGIEHAGEAVAKTTSSALNDVCADVTGATQAAAHGDAYAALNDSIAAAGLPSATNPGLVAPLIPAVDRPFINLLDADAAKVADTAPSGMPMSQYLAQVKANFAQLGLAWGPKEDAAAHIAAMKYPWIDPDR